MSSSSTFPKQLPRQPHPHQPPYSRNQLSLLRLPQPAFSSFQSFHPVPSKDRAPLRHRLPIAKEQLEIFHHPRSIRVTSFTKVEKFFFGFAGVKGAFNAIKELRLVVREKRWGCGDTSGM